MLSRREIAYGTASAAIATGIAFTAVSCSDQQIQNLETQLADVITKVQAAVKGACNLVPTAATVVEVLLALVGTTNPTVAALAGFVTQAIDYIGKACPAPAGAVTAPGAINGKTPPIVFY